MFLRQTTHGCTTFLLYVDNMIINRNDDSSITALKTYVKHKVIMKDLGPLTYFLRLEISYTKDGIRINQGHIW